MNLRCPNRRCLGIIGLVLLLSACGDDTLSAPSKGDKTDVASDGGESTADTGTDSTSDTSGDTAGGTDGGDAGTGGDTGEPIDQGVIDLENPGFIPAPGQIGWPCDANDECDDGWCINSPEGPVCTQFCVDECPQGWTCVEIQQQGADKAFVCAPMFARLCDPCSNNQDCVEFESQVGNVCINYGGAGSFCGTKCQDNEQCPIGYSCQEHPTAEDKQCIPIDQFGAPRECNCSKAATLLGKSTSCFAANAFGTCYGFRECAPGGLTECGAETPQIEICNAQDDNCDNQIDNITVPEVCHVTNEFGTCAGILACNSGLGTGKCDAATPADEVCDGIDQNCDGIKDDGFEDTDGDLQANCVDEDDDNDGIIDEADNCGLVPNTNQKDYEGDTIGDACDPDDDNDGHPDENDCEPYNAAVFPSGAEVCDGEDNDCDNLVDEDLCDDGNMCTDDKCNTDGTCTNTPNILPCDDGTVCTQKDVCTAGQCTGNNPIVCNDNNPCTTDVCDPAVGCLNNFSNDACDDGNKCTDGDICVQGSCQSGPPTVCNDGNECMQALNCSPLSGCAYAPLNGIYCKFNNHSSCGGGLCQGGQCSSQPSGPNGCDDDDACTTGDFCTGGSCSGGIPYNCDNICQQQGTFCIALGTCVELFGSPSCAGGCLCP